MWLSFETGSLKKWLKLNKVLKVGPRKQTYGNWSQTSSLQNCEEINVCHSSLLLLLPLLLLSHFQLCLTLCDPIDSSPPGFPRPWDSPGKNTGVGCHFLLQCMKVKSKSEVAQSCLTPSNPMDCSLPSSSVHGIFQARVLEWGAIAF